MRRYGRKGGMMPINNGTMYNQRDIYTLKRKYDELCKKVLSNKYILAWILKGVVEEFKEIDVTDIQSLYIESVPIISKKLVHSAFQNNEILGMNGDNIILGEGRRTFDIIFSVITPGKYEKLIINLEPQSNYYPGYVLETRMVYYISRMISSQYGKEFLKSDFNGIKKVYSIWICTHPPKSEYNTISLYQFKKEDLVGKQKDRKKYYDKFVVVKICLGNEQYENYTGVIKLLHILLLSEMDVHKKKHILENEFGIPMDGEFEQEVDEVCDLADGLFYRAQEKGWKQGLEKGMQQGMQQGEDLFARLAQKLLCDCRTDELLRATTDISFREQMYETYGIQPERESVSCE